MAPSSNLDYFPISTIQGIFRDYYCGILCYCHKHYIFKKYYLRVNCPFKPGYSWHLYVIIIKNSISYSTILTKLTDRATLVLFGKKEMLFPFTNSQTRLF